MLHKASTAYQLPETMKRFDYKVSELPIWGIILRGGFDIGEFILGQSSFEFYFWLNMCLCILISNLVFET